MKYKRWNGDDGHQNLTNVHILKDDWAVLNEITTNGYFQHHEQCECYRVKDEDRNKEDGDIFSVTENRKFHLKELNVTVWFILSYGDATPLHGHFDIKRDLQPHSCMPTSCRLSSSPSMVIKNKSDLRLYNKSVNVEDSKLLLSSWTTDTMATFVDSFVRTHYPDHVLLNTGFHGALDGKSAFSDKETLLFTKYVRAWRESHYISTKLIFRSTTCTNFEDHVWSHHYSFDTQAVALSKQQVWDYWDVTSTIIEPLYWAYHRIETPFVYFSDSVEESRGFFIDRHHFVYWVYSEFNKAFIKKYFL